MDRTHSSDDGGAARRETIPAAALLGFSPEFIESDALGIKSTSAWIRGVHHAMRDPPEHSAGLEDALGHRCGGGGGSARRGIAGVRAFTCFQPRFLVQRGVGLCAAQKHTETGPTRGWVTLQAFRHGRAMACAMAECRRMVFRHLGWFTTY